MDSNSDTGSHAMLTVSNTYELLEAILSNLPTKDLTQAQRVCRRWKDLIAKSKTIQQKLFLLPVQSAFTTGGVSLLDKFEYPLVLSRCYSHGLENISYHACLLSLKATRQTAMYYGDGKLPVLEVPIQIDRLLSWKPGTWEGMFLTQPPCKALEVDWIRTFSVEILRNDDGLKTREVVDFLRDVSSREMKRRGYKAYNDTFYINIEGLVAQGEHINKHTFSHCWEDSDLMPRGKQWVQQ